MRGQILERFGWEYSYLLNKIPWIDVHLMMVDAPYYIPPKTDDKGKKPPPIIHKPETKAEQAEALSNFLNSF